ncbi:MAG: hypothetical protein ACK4NS_05830 [Saprospiraceae bacterium]
MLILNAQAFSQKMGSAAQAALRQPTKVEASDGIYEKFVLVRWDACEKANNYRLFRALDPSGGSMVELTEKPQQSTWFCDYGAERGKEYYYGVMALSDRDKSPLSAFDKGYLRKDNKVAQEDLLSLSATERLAAGRPAYLLVSSLDLEEKTYASGESVSLSIGLQNIFDDPSLRAELRVYLSQDAVWDFSDVELLNRQYSSFPGNAKTTVFEKITIPMNWISGDYYLIVVSMPEGDILQAKSGVTRIKIKQ